MKVSYKSLSSKEKWKVLRNLVTRRKRYLDFLSNKLSPGSVILVGDRPGPSAPKDPSYHHTPFYSTKHCSGWLNAALMVNSVDERQLVWINAFDKDGNALSGDYIKKYKFSAVIALGGNASKWLSNMKIEHMRTSHPQFHKRFKNSEPYDLLDIIKELT